jgi:Ca2+-binding RTX toxin-like protein
MKRYTIPAAIAAGSAAVIVGAPTGLPKLASAALICFGEIPRVTGTKGDDTLIGSTGTDVIVGLGGHDVIRGTR